MPAIYYISKITNVLRSIKNNNFVLINQFHCDARNLVKGYVLHQQTLCWKFFHPHLPNELFHPDQLDQSIPDFRGGWWPTGATERSVCSLFKSDVATLQIICTNFYTFILHLMTQFLKFTAFRRQLFQ